MPEVSMSVSGKQRVALLARAWGVSEGEAVERLLDEFLREPTQPASQPARVPVHALYSNVRVDGLFDPASHRLEIITGPLVGRTYRSPSGAAIGVISSLDGSVSPNRNGWTFWLVTATGERLQSVRDSR